MVLFEICQRFTSYFLNELRVSLTRIFGFQLAALALKMNHSVTHYVIKISRKIPLNELNELIL